MKTWKITCTVEDGEHEYSDCFPFASAADSLGAGAAAAAVADRWLDTDPDEPEEQEARRHFIRSLREEGRAFLPYDTRTVSGLGWEAVPPITVTVSGGVVQAVTGVPEGVTVEVHDWDGDERDGAGEAVPDIAVWEGPR